MKRNPKATTVELRDVSEKLKLVERHWINGKKQELPVYRIPIEHLYFNIGNGRYADRMLKLRHDHPGVAIDPRQEKWKDEIEKMLAGEHKDTSRDKAAFERLMEDIDGRTQLRPGVVLFDGGVLDGNRRLATLRRLLKGKKNEGKYRYFDGVILPPNTSAEDRWQIEAGLQLGMNERWDYSPINELLKIREGLTMYGQMISANKLPGKRPVELVANAIYGKSAADVEEMAGRLNLIDEYLQFIDDEGAYDRVGERSEDFLEARRIVTAAENQQRSPQEIARLKFVLFYLIHGDLMDNFQLRYVYVALGGDPKKRGRKYEARPEALKEFLERFPDNKALRTNVLPGKLQTVMPKKGFSTGPQTTAMKRAVTKNDAELARESSAVRGDAAAAVERFTRTIETANRTKSARQLAEAVRADAINLQRALSAPEITLSEADRVSIKSCAEAAFETLQASLKQVN
ncbi:hypothetical protein [Pyxidicoccus trucidator]|uniref:hypothetical protein n=1 Tax=Pyxidicoccus trucidator TaxID=2709662 RepID=UPI0013DD720A|nr:hypothetical protein [Pyxidicoccus trucidator]